MTPSVWAAEPPDYCHVCGTHGAPIYLRLCDACAADGASATDDTADEAILAVDLSARDVDVLVKLADYITRALDDKGRAGL
jgi:hypothetical protein